MNAFFITLIHSLAFFGIGLLGASLLDQRRIINKHFIVICAYAISCLIGYGLFFIYLLSPAVGTYCSGLFYLAGILATFYLVYSLSQSAALRKVFVAAVLPVMLFIFSLATLYSVITFSCQYHKVPPQSPRVFYQACVLYDSTGDNVIVQFFGQKILDNHDRDLMGDWHLADRPPLEIGSTISLLDVLPNDNAQRAAYEFFSIILQLSWVAALWALLNVMRVRKQDQYFVLFISSIMGFYYYNSIYAWPKFLAASFGLAALALLVYHPKASRTASAKNWIIATILLTLSLLAHGSSFFLIIPLALYLIVFRKLPSLKTLALCALVGLILYGPWMVYQQRTAPNNRLVKWQLAGATAGTDNRSAPQAISDAYKSVSLKDWAHGRVSNVGTLFKSHYIINQVHIAKDPTEHSLLDRIRKVEFFSLFPALGFLNVGWIVLLYNKLTRRKNSIQIEPLLLIAGIGLLFWVIVLFTPTSTVNHSNSYGLMMVLFTALALSIATASKPVRRLVTSLQLLSFYFVWVYGIYKINNHLLALIPVTGALALYCAAVRHYLIKASQQ